MKTINKAFVNNIEGSRIYSDSSTSATLEQI